MSDGVDLPGWAIFLIVVVAIIFALGLIAAAHQCDASGGVLVRGLFGYECVRR